MARHHLVRVSKLGRIGRFSAVDGARYSRGAEVVVRTSRGLELGEVLAPPSVESPAGMGDGSLLRAVSSADRLLAARLEQHRPAAFDAVTRRLAELSSTATLLEVEPLFDGQTLVFHFLGDVPAEVEAELAEAYESVAQIRRFAETLVTGCGPDCGTAAASGGGCQSCGAGCAVAASCGTRSLRRG
jgi:hypothetical protein